MQLSQRVFETMRKMYLPKWREEIKAMLCFETIADRMLGRKPLVGEERERMRKTIDELPDDVIEQMIYVANKTYPEFEDD